MLEEALHLAATWRASTPLAAIAETGANPDLRVYVEGWPRRGDFGLIAEDAGVAVGAAWYRTFAADSHGYGFIDGSTPEVAIAVQAGHRGRGVGTQLLRALIDHARLDGLAALSLSVEGDNPALAIYRRLGFEVVGRNGSACTMRLALE